MDNTELHYLTYSKDEIWEQMMLNYVAAGGDILYPGDEKEMLLCGVLSDIVHVFAGVDNALRMQTLRYAVGDYLDVLGEQRSCPRIEATKARATVTITTNATGKADTLEAGTTMTADGELFYALVEDFSLTGHKQTATVEIEAVRAGSAGNGLLTGAQMQLAITNGAIDSIFVASDASGGNEREEDETYRARIREYGLVGVSTGPARQYEAAAKAVSSEIVDAKALNTGAGNVGIYLVLESEIGAAAILAAVAEELSATSVRPLTDHVTVYQATDIPYTLNVTYVSDGSATISAAIAAAVEEYKEWQENTIGRAFNPDRLMAAIYQAGATRVTWAAGSVFNGDGPITYTEIAATARCKGTITLTSAM
jgi:phage-related baseplate assembly protein